jgi:hypothetical protein
MAAFTYALSNTSIILAFEVIISRCWRSLKLNHRNFWYVIARSSCTWTYYSGRWEVRTGEGTLSLRGVVGVGIINTVFQMIQTFLLSKYQMVRYLFYLMSENIKNTSSLHYQLRGTPRKCLNGLEEKSKTLLQKYEIQVHRSKLTN